MEMSGMKKSEKYTLGIGAVGLAAALARRLSKKPLSFKGKRVFIAGGTRGLGLVLARHALSLGASVSICGREKATLDRALEELAAKGKAVGSVCDLTKPDQVSAWISESNASLGSPEVLIYCAGIMQVGPFESMQVADYENAMQTHLFGPLHAVNAILPAMKEARGGSIAFIASMGGKRSVPHMLPYDASKFALVGLGEGLAIELAKYGIFVTTVCPATMRTGSPDNATFKGDHRSEFTWFSLLDALPGVSVSAEYAAKKIFGAISKRNSLLVFPWTAKAGMSASALFPSLYVKVMRQVDKALPQQTDSTAYLGKQSHTKLSPSVLTALSETAAAKNNELEAKGGS